MQLIYVAGPYRADTPEKIKENVQRASAVAAALLGEGFAVVCPHSMTHGWEAFDLPDEVFLDNGLEQLRRCDAVVLVAGWERSSGTLAEIDEAKRLGIEVFASLVDVLADGKAVAA